MKTNETSEIKNQITVRLNEMMMKEKEMMFNSFQMMFNLFQVLILSNQMMKNKKEVQIYAKMILNNSVMILFVFNETLFNRNKMMLGEKQFQNMVYFLRFSSAAPGIKITAAWVFTNQSCRKLFAKTGGQILSDKMLVIGICALHAAGNCKSVAKKKFIYKF